LTILFAQFGTADGDMEARLTGYLVALEHATPRALRAAVRAYLCGEVEGHDGRFIPTSAELARVVRAEQAYLDRTRPKPRLVEMPQQISQEERRRRVEVLKALGDKLAGKAS
jgi:hypothetical protein